MSGILRVHRQKPQLVYTIPDSPYQAVNVFDFETNKKKRESYQRLNIDLLSIE